MARKDQLRKQRAGTVINVTSKQQETDIIQALLTVVDHISGRFQTGVSLTHEKQWYLKDIVAELRRTYPDTEFHYHFDRSSIRPDGVLALLLPVITGAIRCCAGPAILRWRLRAILNPQNHQHQFQRG